MRGTRAVLTWCVGLAVVILGSSGLRADGLPRGEPRELGFDPAKLAPIGKLLEDEVAARHIAGGSMLVARKGKIAFLAVAGQQDVAAGTPLTEATIFRIASMTKPMTSVAAMILADQGKLRVSDPVSLYVPEFKTLTVLVPNSGDDKEQVPYKLVPADREITVHHLLTHSSGITYGLFARPFVGELYGKVGVSDGLIETPGTMADNIRRLALAPLLHQPGAAWEYGLNTDVLGRVIEVASGQTLDEFFRTQIFAPLKMNDTSFVVPADKRARLASVYTPADDKTVQRVGDGPQRIGTVDFSATYPLQVGHLYFSGGAGLSSTIGDYSRFLQMLLNGGELDGVRLLKPETVAQMTANQVGDLKLSLGGHGDAFGYGFGIVTDRSGPPPPGNPSVGAYAWGGLFNTYFWVDPQRQLLGVMMTQLFPSGHLKLREDFQQRTYQALVE